MSTDDGVQIVCQGERGSISNYYLEGPLYLHLRELLAFGLSENQEFVHNRVENNGKGNLIFQIMAPLDICTKINLLQKLAASILPEVNQQLQHYILPRAPSPLCTEPPSSPLCTQSPSSPLCTEPPSSLPIPPLPEFSSSPSYEFNPYQLCDVESVSI